MARAALRSSLVLLLACLAGCAAMQPPAGRDFSQTVFASFVLDQTTDADVLAQLGPPMKRATMSGMAKPSATLVAPGTRLSLTTLNYYFAPFGFGLPAPRHPAKTAMLLFFDGRLIAYDVNSAIPGTANVAVDESRLADLHQGQTTRAQAIALLGPPNGQLIHVFDAEQGASQIGYSWAHVDGDTVQQRVLRVFFDKAGHLSTYTLLDNAYPVDSLPIPLPTPGMPAPGNNPGGLPHPQPMPMPMPMGDREHT